VAKKAVKKTTKKKRMVSKKAPAKKTTKRKVAAAKKRSVKVWHIFRFEQRFELPDDVRYCRKSPLVYTRDFVGSGLDDESISYHQQVTALRSMSNFLQLKGAFHELKGIAANRSRCYRGYLLDEVFKPAGDEKISQWLCVNVKDGKKILKSLEQVGLVERVNVPKFDPTKNEPPTDDSDISVRARRSPGAFKKNGNGKGKDKGKKKTAFGNGKRKNGKETASAKPQPAEAEGGNLNQSQGKPGMQGNGKQKGLVEKKATTGRRGEVGREAETPSTPTTAPPLPLPFKPTETDAGGESGSFETLPSSDHAAVAERLDSLYEASAQQFAEEIFKAIQTPCRMDSQRGARELGAFASAWQGAQQARLTPCRLDALWQRSVKEAEKMSRKRKRQQFTNSPEAAWMWVFKRLLNAAVEGKEPKAKIA